MKKLAILVVLMCQVFWAQAEVVYRLDGNDIALESFWTTQNLTNLTNKLSASSLTISLAQLPQTGASTGQAIVWGGTSWVPETVGGGLIIGTTAVTGGTNGNLLSIVSGKVGQISTSIGGNGVGDSGKLAAFDTNGTLAAAAVFAVGGGGPNTAIYPTYTQFIGVHDLFIHCATSVTAARDIYWPDKSGTVALVSDITLAQLPQTGATAGQAVVWNGSIWAPGTVSGGGFTIGTSTTSGAAAGDILTSDGTHVTKLTPGSGVATFLTTPTLTNLQTTISATLVTTGINVFSGLQTITQTTGTDPNILTLKGGASGTTARWNFLETGDFLPAVDATYSIGSSSFRPNGNFFNMSAANQYTGGFLTVGQFIFLGPGYNVKLYGNAANTFQQGQDGASPTTQLFKSADGSGADSAGSDLQIGGGLSTGTGTPGKVVVRTATAGSTGSSLNAYTTRMTIDAGVTTHTQLQTITQGAANTGILSSTGYSLTGADTTSMVSLAGTLNTSGVVNVFDLKITNTLCGSGTNFFRVMAGSTGTTELFSLNYTGGSMGCRINCGTTINNNTINLGYFYNGIEVANNYAFSWSSTGASYDTADLILSRAAAATLQLGVAAASPTTQSIKAADGVGTNIAGSNLYIAGGSSTGNAVPGKVMLRTAAAAGSGSSLNTAVTRLTADSTGVTVGNIILFPTAASVPSANPPTGFFYLYVDPSDTTLRARGPSGTITILATP
jgi:hypothetical protein